ncbi:hypothetical protein niasHT_012417 [Heterodera trifolii]|uniref:Uncharacterized protein n=1 Tax=Heterodera trifolii TaxID=157864 RepID=A0ABD2LAQ0_9BILA
MGLSDVLAKVAFGEEVNEVIICVGTADLDMETPMEWCKEAIKKILSHIGQFGLKIWVVPPPFHRIKAVKHNEFLEMLTNCVPERDLCLMKGFRSILEVTMWGRQEEKRCVDEKGRLKFIGVTAMLKHLKEVFELKVPTKKVSFEMEVPKSRDEMGKASGSVPQFQKFGRLTNANPNSGGNKNFPTGMPNFYFGREQPMKRTGNEQQAQFKRRKYE